jgi:hypothetical protein
LALLLLRDLINSEPESAIIYRHGQVFPGCFIYYDGTVWVHPNVVDVFHNGLLLRLLTADFKRPIWTILDGTVAIPTGTPEANLVVFTSPGQQSDALKHFMKSATLIVHPPWTLEEIELLRQNTYPHLSAAMVKSEFTKWGGVPRILLDWANDPHRYNLLLDSIYTADTETLFRQAGLASIDHSTVSGTHFHLIPGLKAPDNLVNESEINFRYPAYRWASSWIAERFWEELQNNEGELRILNFLLNRNNTPAARGLAFEPHVFRTFENSGLSGRFRKLDGPNSPSTIYSLKGYIRRTFFNFEDLPDDPADYLSVFYVPQQPNHETFDFYIPDQGLMLQITVGKAHNIKRKGLETAASSKLFRDWKVQNNNSKLRIVFVSDQFNFSNFARQPYTGSQGTPLQQTSILAALDNQFSQYAWELDVRNQRREHLNKRRSHGETDDTPASDADDNDDRGDSDDGGMRFPPGKGRGKKGLGKRPAADDSGDSSESSSKRSRLSSGVSSTSSSSARRAGDGNARTTVSGSTSVSPTHRRTRSSSGR